MRVSRWWALAAILVVAGGISLIGGSAAADKGQKRDQIQSELKNAATAEESYAVSHDGNYTRRQAGIEREGFNPSRNVRLFFVPGPKNGYCIEAQHDGLAEIWHYSSNVGAPERGRCGS